MAVIVTLETLPPVKHQGATKWIADPTGNLVIMEGQKASHIYAAGEWTSAVVV